MKRIAILLLLSALLAACQPTPEKEYVVNKGDGALEALIGETTPVPSYDGTQTALKAQLGAPDSVQESFTVKVYGGTLDAAVDASVTVPEVGTVPVFCAAVGWDALKDRTEIVHALLGDTVYRVDLTRATLLSYEAEINRFHAWLSDLNEGKRHELQLSLEEEQEYVQQELATVNEIRSRLSDRAKEPVPWDGSFEPYETDSGFVCLYSAPYLLELAQFGEYLSVAFRDLSVPSASVSGGKPPQQTDAEAIAAAKAFLCAVTDLSVEAFGVEDLGDGTAIALAPVRADIPCLPLRYYHGDDMGYDAVNGQDYALRMQPETVTVNVRDGRVTSFRWESPLYVTGTENENVVLLPFSEIMDVFRSHIRAAYYLSYDERTGEEAHARAHITSIRLSYARVDKKDSDGFYLLPVWDFIGYDEYVGWSDDPAINARVNDGRKEIEWNCSFLTVNAIDGSVIDRNLGH